MSEEVDAKVAKLHEAVANHARRKDGDFIVRWILIAETLDEVGDKSLQMFRGPTGDALPVWDVRGFLYQMAQTPDLFEEDED